MMKHAIYRRWAVAATVSLTVIAVGPSAFASRLSRQQSQSVLQKNTSAMEFSLSLGAGYLTGESHEMVYWPEYGNHKASELTWNIDNLFMVGIEADLKLASRFNVKCGGWFKATDGEGTMDDYDWAIVGADWTDWSHHEDTDVTEGTMIDLSGEYAFWQQNNMSFNVILGYRHDNFGWEAKGGDYVYSEGGFRNYTGSFADGEPGIGYEQTMDVFYTGLGMDAAAGKFSFAGRIIYSPIVQADATDHHYMRDLVTEDEFDNGDMYSLELSAGYAFTRNFSLNGSFTYLYYDEMQGDSQWDYNAEGYSFDYPDSAGMDHKSMMFGLSVCYTF